MRRWGGMRCFFGPGLLSLVLLGGGAAHADSRAGIEGLVQQGPLDIPVAGTAVLHLPAGYDYLPRAPALQFMAAMGSPADSHLQGLVLPQQRGLHWLVVLGYGDSGHIRDDDARRWNPDQLLESLKQSTEAANDSRRRQRLAELEVVGWAQSPTYNAGSHQLLWSPQLRERSAAGTEPQTVDYRADALGRDGYVSLNLVTDSAHLDDEKHIVQALLDNLGFNPGRRYEDFRGGGERVAPYGIAALVVGEAAGTPGLLAQAGDLVSRFCVPLALLLVLAVVLRRRRSA